MSCGFRITALLSRLQELRQAHSKVVNETEVAMKQFEDIVDDPTGDVTCTGLGR